MNKSFSKNYNTVIEFTKFLRENGDKLFEKDSKLCLQTEQLLILQEYLQQITANSSANLETKTRKNSNLNNKEFLLLYKSNQLHFIQDFLFKITKLKITTENNLIPLKDLIKLNIFGSLIYLELKNCPIYNIFDLQNLRNQLEILTCIKSITKLQDLLVQCGADQSSPTNWSKLHTLNLSYNQLTSIDNSFRLTTSLEILDLSHNNLKDCGEHLHNLIRLKRLNLSFNKLESIPSLCPINNVSAIEYLDLSYNNIENIQIENISKLGFLKHLNLTNNLISELVEVNHLRLLSSISEILVDRNPVKLNPSTDSIIKEIIAIVELKNNLKKTPHSTPWNSSNINPYIPNRVSAATRINISKNRASTTVDKYNDFFEATSAPDHATNLYLNSNGVRSTRKATFTGGSAQKDKRKLKANNILIEQEQENTPDDFYIVNSDQNDADTLVVSLNKSNTIAKLSTSHGTEYDPNKLQVEIENLKKMRQNYGTDWLLSTPNLITNVKIPEKLNAKKSEINPASIRADQASDYLNKLTIDETIESYVVYKLVEFVFSNGETDKQEEDNLELCILSLNERCIIERDETNTDVLALNEFINLEDIQVLKSDNEEKPNKVRITFKESTTSRVYQFENDHELSSFIERIKKIVFNKINIEKCELYFCEWCNEFGKKSKFTLDDESHTDDDLKSETFNLTCTKCNKYLIKENQIQSKDEVSESGSIKLSTSPQNPLQGKQSRGNSTLKDVLKSFKTDANSPTKDLISYTEDKESINEDTKSINNKELNDILTDSIFNSTSEFINESASKLDENFESNKQQESQAKPNESNLENKLELLLSNNQLTKAKLDEISNESKRINNNLKLYLIINYLNENSNQNKIGKANDDKNAKKYDDDESLVCTFRMKYFFHNLSSHSGNTNQPSSSVTSNSNYLNSDMYLVENCLCLFTNRNITLFKVLNQDLFNQNIDFDKCLKLEFSIEVNQIEVVEVSLGQYYLIVETSGGKNRNYFKFITYDIYYTQAFLNILLKIINESKSVTSLKQIRKKNEQTNQSLAEIIKNYISFSSEPLDASILPISQFSLVENLKINDETPNSAFEQKAQVIFLYNDEKLVLVEENLNYYSNTEPNTQTINKRQFNFIDSAKISDIVHLKLFNDSDTKLEISIVDELKNSQQIQWTFNLNKQYLLSQLIAQLKQVWEKIFSVESPISFE